MGDGRRLTGVRSLPTTGGAAARIGFYGKAVSPIVQPAASTNAAYTDGHKHRRHGSRDFHGGRGIERLHNRRRYRRPEELREIVYQIHMDRYDHDGNLFDELTTTQPINLYPQLDQLPEELKTWLPRPSRKPLGLPSEPWAAQEKVRRRRSPRRTSRLHGSGPEDSVVRAAALAESTSGSGVVAKPTLTQARKLIDSQYSPSAKNITAATAAIAGRPSRRAVGAAQMIAKKTATATSTMGTSPRS
jgi:hypothetical protein